LKKYKNKGLNILEIGAAHGLNLKITSEKIDCENKYALEIDNRWYNQLNKQNIKIIDNLEIDVNFDIIILSHVLEHFTDPLNELKNISNSLNVNGIIYIEVPNVNYDDTNLHKSFNIAHTFYFDELSLVKICDMAGLRILETKCNDVLKFVCCAR
jgi:2-polyprenyl-3-methyl-5-hydroxy-6-metoxy-1,4-benzoquinol methylase